MAKRLVKYVTVHHEGVPYHFGPGDDLPKWAESAIGNTSVFADESKKPKRKPTPKPEPEPVVADSPDADDAPVSEDADAAVDDGEDVTPKPEPEPVVNTPRATTGRRKTGGRRTTKSKA